MSIYDFTLILSKPNELTDEFTERLFSAGCDDSTPSSCDGVLSVDFSREASDLESAIRSAISNTSARPVASWTALKSTPMLQC